MKCPCEDCIRKTSEDSLRHSLSRVSEYRALASPSLIALSSNDPLQTAFQVGVHIRLSKSVTKRTFFSIHHLVVMGITQSGVCRARV